MKTCEAGKTALSYHSDERLATCSAAGNLEAFEELLRRYRQRVFRLCFRMAANREDAEDWAQECFVRVYQQLGSFNPARPFAPWLLRVVANTTVNLARSRARRTGRIDLGLDADDLTAPGAADPSQAAEGREERRRARMAVEGLPPLLRPALVLRIEEELSFREIAGVLGVPLQTAAARVRRALIQLRVRLGGGEEG
jgi:RNA polymerase sigma-70 factor (ECF subfamily)